MQGEHRDERATVECSVGDSPLMEFLIDSGAEINVLSEAAWELLEADFEAGHSIIYDVEASSKKRIMAYASSVPLQVRRTFQAWIYIPGTSKPRVFAKFFVIAGGARSLIGRKTAEAMQVLRIGLEVSCMSLEEPSEAIEPFPRIPGEEIEFDIDESVVPTKNAYYNVPAAYAERARERLASMEKQDIIEKVTRAPRWISGMSAVAKGKSDFRLVVGMKGPNRAIRRQFHRIPILDDMRRKLTGARRFSKLDLKNAFYHLPLGEKSRDLTTFMTESGMFRFKRLVFGVNCAPEIFQRVMEQVLAGIAGVIVFIDDILIFAESEEELSERTALVLAALCANNLTLNTGKCEYNRERITFIGHELSADGFNIDKAKVQTIRNFRRPKSPSELKSFLGLASYVSSYIPRFADMTAPLWKVTGDFAWESEQQAAYDKTKEAIAECTTTQGYFDDHDETILYTDASPDALGAVLVQVSVDGASRIISFASKTLTPTEKRYPQTQREALAIVWATEHFNYFLLGRKFTIRTDALGVAFIFNRDRETTKRTMTRADGWGLRMSSYDFTIEFVKGSFNIADPSSRLHEGTDGPYVEGPGPCEIAALELDQTGNMVLSESLTLAQVKDETAKDGIGEAIAKALESEEWPEGLRRYEMVKDELCWMDGYALKSGAVILPPKLRPKAVMLAHKGHPGATSMKSILRARVWWPGMTKDIEECVKRCESCTLMMRKNPPVPMTRSRLPENSWDAVAVDFNGPYARFGGVSILVLVDCFSRFLTAAVVKSTDFRSTKRVLDELFGRLGFPETIKSDNGPPFSGAEYKSYCEARGIEPMYSTPGHPQQNGMVERYMQVVNKAMQIAAHEGTDYNEELRMAVRAHNAAVHRVTQVAPEELMYGRKIRRDLPLATETRTAVDLERLRERDAEEKQKAKLHEDRKRQARDTELVVGDAVAIWKPTRAKGDPKFDPTPFTIRARREGDLELASADGRILKRNVIHVKKLPDGHEQEQGALTAEAQAEEEDVFLMPPQQRSTRRIRNESVQLPRRSARITRAPKHFDMYIRLLNSE